MKIKVYSDYVCPFCFLAEQPLEEAIKGKDVEVEWMPYELRPYPNEEDYRDALTTRKYKEAHKKALKHAYEEANVTAVPTFVIGDTTIAGIHSKETLEQIINDELNRQKGVILTEGMACDIDGC